MKRIYRLPIMGKVTSDKPLTGDAKNPLSPIPLEELLDIESLPADESSIGCVCLEYNVDEDWVNVEVEASEIAHERLLNLMPQLKAISKEKGWKLDKTELEKTRRARVLDKR